MYLPSYDYCTWSWAPNYVNFLLFSVSKSGLMITLIPYLIVVYHFEVMRTLLIDMSYSMLGAFGLSRPPFCLK